MAGQPGNIFVGTDRCGAYQNALGSYQERKISIMCGISIALVSIIAFGACFTAYKIIQAADLMKVSLKLTFTPIYGDVVDFEPLVNFVKIAGYTYMITSIPMAIITYVHCKRCNGGVGFFKILGLWVLAYACVKIFYNNAVDNTVDSAVVLSQKARDEIKTYLKAIL